MFKINTRKGKIMDALQMQSLWERTLESLSTQFPSVVMEVFFKDTSLVFLNEKMAVVQNQSDNLRTSLAMTYADAVTEHLSGQLGRPVTVYFESAEKKPVDLDKYRFGGSVPLYSGDGKYDAEPDYVVPGSAKYGNFFDARYTFDNFIVGSSNKFAHAACAAVAREGANAGYNPLFVYGNSGLGKTHLLHAIINATLLRDPAAKIVYTTCEDFTNEIIAAIKNSSTAQLRDKYRKADMLLIDDVQFLAGKEATQEEFFHTFNTLYSDCRQIVLTSDRPARDITPLSDRIRGRFESGLTADIQPPDYELRIAIMRSKAQTYHAKFPDEVFEFLAEHLKNNVRQMEGAIKKIAAQSFLANADVNVAVAAQCISDLISEDEPDSAIVDRVLSVVSKKYGIPVEEIRGKKRTKEIVRARHIAIYIIHTITEMSLPKIGQEFDRNHSTILSSLSVIEEELKKKNFLELEIQDMIKEIKE